MIDHAEKIPQQLEVRSAPRELNSILLFSMCRLNSSRENVSAPPHLSVVLTAESQRLVRGWYYKVGDTFSIADLLMMLDDFWLWVRKDLMSSDI